MSAFGSSNLAGVGEEEEDSPSPTTMPYVPTPSELKSAEASNTDGLAVRWQEAMGYFNKSCATFRSRRTSGSCSITAIIDISGSMDGTKLIAVKLGICAIVANLNDDDEMNITAFSVARFPVTNGFKRAAELRVTLPKLLQKLDTDGSTACYDAIVAGINELRGHLAVEYPSLLPAASGGGSSSSSSSSSENKMEMSTSITSAAANENGNAADSSSSTNSNSNSNYSPETTISRKNVTIVLTDGEDNASSAQASAVESLLINPGINKFMFIMVAVGMSSNDEARFRRWMDLVHCKQVSVSVRTGNSLVSVFKETLLSRIFHTEHSSTRFLQESAVYDSSALQSSAAALEELRSNLIRQIPGIQTAPQSANVFEHDDVNDNDDDDAAFGGGNMRYYSNAVSVSNSPRALSPTHSPGNRSRGNSDDFDFQLPDDYRSNGGSFDSNDNSAPNTPRRPTGGRPGTPPPELYQANGRGGGGGGGGIINFFRTLVGGRAGTPPPKRGSFSPSSFVATEPLAAPMSEEMLQKFPKECICPITHEIMQDPVMCEDGHSYERGAIEHWLQKSDTSPLTNLPISHCLVPNHTLRKLIESIKETLELSAADNSSSSSSK